MAVRDAVADLGGALRDWRRQYGDRPAAIAEQTSLSFAALDRAADAWAAHVAALGIGRGAHVGLLAANTPGWLAAAFGVWRAGATLVPISTFVTARELADTLADGDIDTLIVQPRLHSHDYLALLDEIPPAARPTHILRLDEPLPARSSAAPGAAIDPESIACILYTSGTTGRAKGVMLSHRAILATMRPTSLRSGLTPDDALLSTLPLFWVAGLVIRALPTLAAGCALILLERFTVEAALTALRRDRPTALHLRPPQVGQLLADRGFDSALLAPVRRGGGRVDWFAPHLDPTVACLTTGYGMTETAGYVTALDWRDPPAVRAVGLGTPLPGVELRVVDATGVACPPDQSGEIRVRGPGLFSGYYKQPPGAGLDAEGFFKTGDLGQIDADGTFHFSGRSKDLLRVKGINVSPVEVETVLAAHPSIEAVYVVGLPHDGLDQEVVALIVPRDPAAANAAALRRLAAAALSHYKRPAHYLTIGRDDVVLGGTAKPQRAALAALATRLMKRPSTN